MRRILRRWSVGFGVTALVLTGSAVAVAAVSSGLVGPHPDGTALTTYGWRVMPAGKQAPRRTTTDPRSGPVRSGDHGEEQPVARQPTAAEPVDLAACQVRSGHQ
jgi:hypothetical protein